MKGAIRTKLYLLPCISWCIEGRVENLGLLQQQSDEKVRSHGSLPPSLRTDSLVIRTDRTQLGHLQVVQHSAARLLTHLCWRTSDLLHVDRPTPNSRMAGVCKIELKSVFSMLLNWKKKKKSNNLRGIQAVSITFCWVHQVEKQHEGRSGFFQILQWIQAWWRQSSFLTLSRRNAPKIPPCMKVVGPQGHRVLCWQSPSVPYASVPVIISTVTPIVMAKMPLSGYFPAWKLCYLYTFGFSEGEVWTFSFSMCESDPRNWEQNVLTFSSLRCAAWHFHLTQSSGQTSSLLSDWHTQLSEH